ncbi:MAG: hypothetical protein WCS37_22710, partial [Chloroflexota bacterium]
INTLQLGFANKDEPLLLLTLPLLPATRFRTLYGLVLVERLGNILLLLALNVGITLAIKLGWVTLSWVLLLLAGAAVVVCGTICFTLLLVRFALPHLQVLIKLSLGLVVGLGALIGWLYLSQFNLTISAQTALLEKPLIPVTPELMAIGLLAIGGLLFGPLAGRLGLLYVAALHTLQSLNGSSLTFNLPGSRIISLIIGQPRGLTAALTYKAWYSQSRNPMFAVRLLLIVVALGFFPVLRDALTPNPIARHLFVIGYILVILQNSGELLMNAFSGEGDRLTLYLTAPFSLSQLLRSKLYALGLPVLVEGLALSLLLGQWAGFSWLDQGLVTITIALIACGNNALLIWGSIWGEDLSLPVEGAIQTFMLEEGPLGRHWLKVFGLSLMLQVGGLGLVWILPSFLGLIALVLLIGLVLRVSWNLSLLR